MSNSFRLTAWSRQGNWLRCCGIFFFSSTTIDDKSTWHFSHDPDVSDIDWTASAPSHHTPLPKLKSSRLLARTACSVPALRYTASPSPATMRLTWLFTANSHLSRTSRWQSPAIGSWWPPKSWLPASWLPTIGCRQAGKQPLAASKLASNLLEASKLASNLLDASRLAFNLLNASKLASNFVDASKLASNLLDASKLASNLLDASKLAANHWLPANLVPTIVCQQFWSGMNPWLFSQSVKKCVSACIHFTHCIWWLSFDIVNWLVVFEGQTHWAGKQLSHVSSLQQAWATLLWRALQAWMILKGMFSQAAASFQHCTSHCDLQQFAQILQTVLRFPGTDGKTALGWWDFLMGAALTLWRSQRHQLQHHWPVTQRVQQARGQNLGIQKHRMSSACTFHTMQMRSGPKWLRLAKPDASLSKCARPQWFHTPLWENPPPSKTTYDH